MAGLRANGLKTQFKKKIIFFQQEIVKYPSSLTFPLEEMHWRGLQR